MKAIRVKVPKLKKKVDELFSLLDYNGFSISNPDCKKGNYLDIVVKDGRKVAGMDLLINGETWPSFESNELYLVTDWVEDHNGKTN